MNLSHNIKTTNVYYLSRISEELFTENKIYGSTVNPWAGPPYNKPGLDLQIFNKHPSNNHISKHVTVAL